LIFCGDAARASRTQCKFSFDRADPGGLVSERRRVGRAEAGLERNLADARHVPAAARAALRVLARGLDRAEQLADPDLIATAGNAYFHALAVNGLTVVDTKPADVFEQLLADMARAGTGAGDTPPP
jgi:hypothetical protein